MINKAIVHANTNKLFVGVMTFGDWLRQQIKLRNLSNAEVARRAKVSATYIGNLVRDFAPNTKSGVGKPSEDVLAAIVKAVGGNLNEARLAAGYAPENASQQPTPIIEAIAQSGNLSDADYELTANFIRLLNEQRGKEKEKKE